MHKSKKIITLVIAIIMLLVWVATSVSPVLASEVAENPKGLVANVDVSTLTNDYVISEAGTYTFTGTTTQYGIIVTATGNNTAAIILDNCTIDLSANSSSKAAIELRGSETEADCCYVRINIEENSTNTLKASGSCAGIQKNAGNSSRDLTINGFGENNALYVYGGNGGGAGIGGKNWFSTTNIYISNATIYAYGGSNTGYGSGAGIGGGGQCGNARSLIFTNSTITAQGGAGTYAGAGIGGGGGSPGILEGNPNINHTSYVFGIKIDESNVTATGGTGTQIGGAGIGGGGNDVTHHVVQANGVDQNFYGGFVQNISIFNSTVVAQGKKFAAGIGGSNYGHLYGFSATGTKTNITANGGEYGAGIGGGKNGFCRDFQTQEGTITATGGNYAAGIGGGGGDNTYFEPATMPVDGVDSDMGLLNNTYAESLHILGGTVNATSGSFAAAIGGGVYGYCKNITVEKGSVTATATGSNRGENGGAGIGTGKGGTGTASVFAYDIKFYGGTTRATGVAGAAGIGGSVRATHVHNIDVRGDAHITAIGGSGGAGIGSGGDFYQGFRMSKYTDLRNINIYSGTVIANGKSGGAGIGSGSANIEPKNITISGGNVTATGSVAEEMSQADAASSAGIGGGLLSGCDGITITGGTVVANGGRISQNYKRICAGAGIGAGGNPPAKNLTVSALNITISGGNITATAGGNTCDEHNGLGSAGIGGSQYPGYTRNLLISGGNISAYGTHGGAGIGSGEGGQLYGTNYTTDASLRITGGEIFASGDTDSRVVNGGAGIGGGAKAGDTDCSSSYVSIEGSNTVVNAQGGNGGAGIGAGYNASADHFSINLAEVNATGGNNAVGIGGYNYIQYFDLSGANITAKGTGAGCAVGTVTGAIQNLNFNGGNIVTIKGSTAPYIVGSAANGAYTPRITSGGTAVYSYNILSGDSLNKILPYDKITYVALADTAITSSNYNNLQNLRANKDGQLCLWLPSPSQFTAGFAANPTITVNGGIYRLSNGGTALSTTFINTNNFLPSAAVVIDANGGSWTANNGSVLTGKTTISASGASYTIQHAPTRNGYTFAGWVLTGAGSFSNSTYTFAGSGEGTLTAQWTGLTGTIAFNSNGGTGTMSSISATNGIGTIPVGTFTKSGYTFAGWNTNSDLTGKSFKNGAAIEDLITASGATTTLYAKWRPVTFFVRFNKGEGATGTMDDQLITYNSSITLIKCRFTKAEHKFLGWSLTEGGKVEYKDEETLPALNAESGEIINLYAVWENIRFSISYDVGDYAVPNTKSYLSGYTVYIENCYRAQYRSVWNYEFEKFTFVNGCIDSDGELNNNSSYPSSIVSNRIFLTSDNTYTIQDCSTQDVTWCVYSTFGELMEKCETSTYTPSSDCYVRLCFKEGLSSQEQASLRVTNDEEGQARFQIRVLMTGNIKLIATFTPITLNVTFNAAGGTVSPESMTVSATGTYGTLPVPVRKGYNFIRWYAEGRYGSIYTITAESNIFSINGNYQNHTLFAEWTALENDITFDMQGGNVSGSTASITETINNASGVLSAQVTTWAPVRTGYSFAGFYTQPNKQGVLYATEENGNLFSVRGFDFTEATTLYAGWTGLDCTVTYNYFENGGTSVTTVDATVPTGNNADLSPEATKSGWTFVGWNTNKDATTALGSVTVPYGGITLYAIYSKTLTLSFASGINSATVSTKTVTIYNKQTGSTVTIPAPASLSAYSWATLGWRDDKTAGASENQQGSSIAITTTNTGTSYYAVYSRNVSIAYDGNGALSGSVASHTDTQYYNSGNAAATGISFTYAQNAFTRTGYSFRAWAMGSVTGTQYQPGVQSLFAPAVNSTACTQQMYAVWVADLYTVSLVTNGGTINSGNISNYTYESGATLPVNITKQGFVFEGWFSESNFSGSRVTTISAGTTGNKTFYAKWRLDESLITASFSDCIDTDQLKCVNPQTGAEENMASLSDLFTNDHTTVTISEIQSEQYYPQKDGYIFAGWYKNASDAQALTASQAYKSTDVINPTDTLYAGWLSVEDVAINANDTSIHRKTVGETPTAGGYEMFGVQMRISEKETDIPNSGHGIRFCMRISKDLLSSLDRLDGSSVPTYGFVALQKKYIDEYNTAHGTNIMMQDGQAVKADGSAVMRKQQSERVFFNCDDYLVYTCVVTGVPVEKFNADLACRPYIEYKDANGATRTIYTTEDSSVQHQIGGAYYNNIYDVSKYIVDNGFENETVRTILTRRYIEPFEAQ